MKAQLALFGATILAAVACGARTGLEVPLPPELDAGPDVEDAGLDAPPDVVDAPPDAPVVDDCQEAGVTYIYLITEENELYSFYPPAGEQGLTDIGTIDCPVPPEQTPFSMAVDRTGIAYVVFSDFSQPQSAGSLFRVSTADATCTPTPYEPTQFGAGKDFGMGFSADTNDPGEMLYVASDDGPDSGGVPEMLGTIDLTAWQLDPVGTFPQHIGSAELSGTGDGRLFGFGVDQASSGTSYHLLQFDKTNAGIVAELPLQMPTGTQGIVAWAFAFWGGSFYFFTSTGTGSSMISRYDPKAGDVQATATLQFEITNTIVGAGVSTCAPQH